MTTVFEIRLRGGGHGIEPSEPYLTLPDLHEALTIASILSGARCQTLDVLDSGRYVVTYCGASPHWWLPGTLGGGMHQISSHGWCHDCRNGEYVPRVAENVFHLSEADQVAVFTVEGERDRVLRKRLYDQHITAGEHARLMLAAREPHDPVIAADRPWECSLCGRPVAGLVNRDGYLLPEDQRTKPRHD